MKKNKKILFFLIILILIWFIVGVINNFQEQKNKSYSERIEYFIVNKERDKETYSVLKNKTVNNLDLSETTVKKKIETTQKSQEQKWGVSTIFSPFYSTKNWVSQINNIEYDRITLEIKNNGNESIEVDENFIYYLGNNDDGYFVETKIIEGGGELKPGETKKIVAKGNGDARYFVIGGNDLDVKNWAIYRVMSTATTANDLNLPAANAYPKYIIDAVPLTADFEEFSLLPCTTYYLEEDKYASIKIKDNNPETIIMVLKIDLYNKMQEKLIINGTSFIIKDLEHKNVETFKIEDFNDELSSKQRKNLFIPFKYIGNDYLYSVILHTNLGDITIENPETIYGLMKLN